MFHRKIQHIPPLHIVVFIVAPARSEINPANAQQASGTVVADLGFRPDGNGFGFPNYGADTPVTNLTPDEMRRLLDDSVCAILKDNKCTLVPEIQQLMDTLNGKMGGGHCEGMAVLSTLLFANKENAADFGQGQPTAFDFNSNAKLQRSEEHTSELQSRQYLVCRLLLEKKNKNPTHQTHLVSLAKIVLQSL